MKKNSSILLTIITLLFFCCKKSNEAQIITLETQTGLPAKPTSTAFQNTATFNIQGMTCKMGCAKTIEKKLSKLPGVSTATVVFEEEQAIVLYDKEIIDAQSIIKTVSEVSEVYSTSNLKILERNINLEK